MFIELRKDSMTVHLHKESNKINIRRRVRQGDTISPKLFIIAPESIFRRLTWKTICTANILDIFAAPTTYSYTLIYHTNYNKCYRNQLMIVKIRVWKLTSRRQKLMLRKRHTNICQQHSDRDTAPETKSKTHHPSKEQASSRTNKDGKE